MADANKGMKTVDATLDAARTWAAEHIAKKYTGTMVIEIAFLDGGVRVPVVTETRVMRVKAEKNGVD